MTALLRIATRRSPLALWQAEDLAARLRLAHPGLTIELVARSTAGDRMLESPLAQIGGKGLFIKDLEAAIMDGEADIAAHSLKDVPAHLPDGFALGAILERADPRDALVSPRAATIADLPAGARVGSSSQRRRAHLLHLRPDVVVLDVRGNVGTRLQRLDAGDFDALLLAAAGLKRLGLQARIRQALPVSMSLPAAGQGAVAVEYRADDQRTAALLAAVHHLPTARVVRAERAVSAVLGGDCTLPLAAHAREDGAGIELQAVLASPDGRERIPAQARGSDPEALGQRVGQQILAAGGVELLRRLRPGHG